MTCQDCGGPTTVAEAIRCRPCYFVELRRRFDARIADRFWAKVDQRGPDECWPWLGHLTMQGYGQVAYDRRTTGAHRIAWLVTHGPIAEGQVVRHSCDNPPCVNPAHLEIGTQLDNIRDRVERGRSAKERPSSRGALHWTARRRAMEAVA